MSSSIFDDILTRMKGEGEMMTIRLSSKWIDKMKSLPESGMGYQNVRVRLKNGMILGGMVRNSDSLDVIGDVLFGISDIVDIDLFIANH